MVSAIAKEAIIRKNYLQENVSTIYFGGGTPSLLLIDDAQFLIDEFRNIFLVDEDAEITLEANPDDITEEKLAGWKQCGINRLSIGVQSFFDEDLIWMNRAHNASEAGQSIKLAQDKGFSNITIDLIYGVPGMTNERWKANIDKAIALHIPHLSCYALTVESKTALDKMILLGKKENINADVQGRHFKLLMQWMQQAGYEHYEISNFAKPGMRSRHNSSYWQGKPYLGLGPSAHSFNGKSRQWNISNNNLYIKNIEEGTCSYEEEILTNKQQENEYIMTTLRTSEGISLTYIKEKFGKDETTRIFNLSLKYIQQELMVANNEYLILTNKGKLFADGIAADLFV